MNYTLIIPHRNSSILLERLLKSVGIHDGFQTIVVDDNSTPEEFVSLARLQRRFSFELYKNEGKYAGGARNTGTKYAKGKWLIYADADDYFADGLWHLLESLHGSEADVVFFNVSSVVSETGAKANRDHHIKWLFKKWADTKDENYFRCMYLVPWGKVYSRLFVEKHNIRFDETIAGNDMMFAVRCGVEAKRISVIDEVFYVCTVSAGSITTVVSRDRHEAKFQATLSTNDYLRDNGLSKYQVSVLFFIAKSFQFGNAYFLHIIKECIKHRSNLLIGTSKILHYRQVLEDRQNPQFSKKKNDTEKYYKPCTK